MRLSFILVKYKFSSLTHPHCGWNGVREKHSDTIEQVIEEDYNHVMS